MNDLKQIVEAENSKGITRRQFASALLGGIGAGLVLPAVSYAGGFSEKFGLSKGTDNLDEVVANNNVQMYNMLSPFEEVDIKNALKNSKTDYGALIIEAGANQDSNYKRKINLSVVFVSETGKEPKDRLFYKSFVNQDALYPHENGKGVENAVSVPPVKFKKEGDIYMSEPFLVSGNTYANAAQPMIATTNLMVAITNEADNICNAGGKILKPESVMCLTPEINCEYNVNKSTKQIDLKQIYR